MGSESRKGKNRQTDAKLRRVIGFPTFVPGNSSEETMEMDYVSVYVIRYVIAYIIVVRDHMASLKCVQAEEQRESLRKNCLFCLFCLCKNIGFKRHRNRE